MVLTNHEKVCTRLGEFDLLWFFTWNLEKISEIYCKSSQLKTAPWQGVMPVCSWTACWVIEFFYKRPCVGSRRVWKHVDFIWNAWKKSWSLCGKLMLDQRTLPLQPQLCLSSFLDSNSFSNCMEWACVRTGNSLSDWTPWSCCEGDRRGIGPTLDIPQECARSYPLGSAHLGFVPPWPTFGRPTISDLAPFQGRTHRGGWSCHPHLPYLPVFNVSTWSNLGKDWTSINSRTGKQKSRNIVAQKGWRKMISKVGKKKERERAWRCSSISAPNSVLEIFFKNNGVLHKGELWTWSEYFLWDICFVSNSDYPGATQPWPQHCGHARNWLARSRPRAFQAVAFLFTHSSRCQKTLLATSWSALLQTPRRPRPYNLRV